MIGLIRVNGQREDAGRWEAGDSWTEMDEEMSEWICRWVEID